VSTISKFFVETCYGYGNDEYYYITFKTDKYDAPEFVARELNIPFEDYLQICQENNSIIVSGFSDVADVFKSKKDAESTLQELLEYSIIYNRNKYKIDIDNLLNIYSDTSDTVAANNKAVISYPNDFFLYKNGVPISDDRVNEWLNRLKQQAIDGELDYYSLISSGNTFVMCTKHTYGYSFVVAKDYGEYHILSDENDDKKIKEDINNQLNNLEFVNSNK